MIRGDSLPSASDLAQGGRLLARLPTFLRQSIRPEEARAVLCRRLEHREHDFLALIRRAVYGHRRSPYRRLLDLAGCEYGDLERLVVGDGVEGALHTLHRHGVYLTVDEFKGRRPLVRGGQTIAVSPDAWRNPASVPDVPLRSGASRGLSMQVPVDLGFVRETAVDKGLMLGARGGMGWHHANWGVPGGALLVQILRFTVAGATPARWFWQVDVAAPGLHPRYRWSARLLRWGGLLAGIRLPRPVYASLREPLPIARWMADALRDRKVPHLHTFSSSAVRLCQAALDAGLDLRGAHFTLTSEAITEARLAVIRRSGARASPRYGTVECGPIGYGCLAPQISDEVHLLHDLHALIQPEPDGRRNDLPSGALLASSLRLTAPLILVNVSLGDQARVTTRRCGCPLESLGWTTHLHTIRSFEKLTAAGMTFADTDVVRVLEEVLPARFGGGPTSYQLVEDETGDGRPRLRLFVHPAVGPVSPDSLADTFLTALSRGSGAERVMGQLWRDSGLLRVERQAPFVTSSGKVLHLHLLAR